MAEPHGEIVMILALDPPSQPERSLHMCPMWLVVCCVPQVCCGPFSVPMRGSGKGTSYFYSHPNCKRPFCLAQPVGVLCTAREFTATCGDCRLFSWHLVFPHQKFSNSANATKTRDFGGVSMAGPIIPTLRELPPSLLAGRMALCSSLLVRSVHQRQTWVDHRPPFVAHTVSCMRVRVYVVLVVLALRRSILKPQPCLCAVLFSATLVCQVSGSRG